MKDFEKKEINPYMTNLEIKGMANEQICTRKNEILIHRIVKIFLITGKK